MSLATAPSAAVVEVVEVSVADLAACAVVLVVCAVVAVVAVVAGGPTETGAVLQPAIVNDEQSLANKFFTRPYSL